MTINTKRIIIGVTLLVCIGAAVAAFFYVTSKKQAEIIPVDLHALYASGKIDEVIAFNEEYLVSNPNSVVSLLSLATALAQKGSIEYDEQTYGEQAIEIAKRVLAIESENSEAYRIIGYANEIMERYQEAFAAYDKALQLDPNNVQARSNKGHAHSLLGDFVKAKEEYEIALAIDPDFDHALYNLARLFIAEHDYVSASPFLFHILENSDSVDMLSSATQALGTIALYSGEYADAVQYYTEALTYTEKSVSAWTGLAEARLYVFMTEDQSDEMYKSIFLAAEKALIIHPGETQAYLVLADAFWAGMSYPESGTMLDLAEKFVSNDISLNVAEKESLRELIIKKRNRLTQ